MKRIFSVLCTMFLMAGICLMNSCAKEVPPETIKVTATSELSEYDVDTHTAGAVLSQKKISCGKRYKLSFNFDFTNIEEVLGENTLNVTMTVQLGEYENEENKALLNGRYIPDGINFSSKGNGTWQAGFVLSADDKPDFEKGYFIVGIDSLGNGERDGMGSTEEITVQFTVEDGQKYEFKFNGSSEYATSLLSTKGDFEFTQENNIVTQIGIEAERNNMTIVIPQKCGEITIDFYEDGSKATIYGTERLNSETNAAAFEKNEIEVLISDYMKGFLGTQKYDEMLRTGEIPIYLVITAVGGNNYNDGIIEMDFNVK